MSQSWVDLEASSGLKVKKLSTQAHHVALRASKTRQMPDLRRPIVSSRVITRMPWLAIATAVSSVVVLLGIATLALNWLEVYLVFFGDQPDVETSNITVYRIWGTIVALALVCGALAHILNPRRRALGSLWQALLMIVGAGIIVLSYIPGAVDLPASVPDDDGHRAPPCYSGGDSDECVGG